MKQNPKMSHLKNHKYILTFILIIFFSIISNSSYAQNNVFIGDRSLTQKGLYSDSIILNNKWILFLGSDTQDFSKSIKDSLYISKDKRVKDILSYVDGNERIYFVLFDNTSEIKYLTNEKNELTQFDKTKNLNYNNYTKAALPFIYNIAEKLRKEFPYSNNLTIKKYNEYKEYYKNKFIFDDYKFLIEEIEGYISYYDNSDLNLILEHFSKAYPATTLIFNSKLISNSKLILNYETVIKEKLLKLDFSNEYFSFINKFKIIESSIKYFKEEIVDSLYLVYAKSNYYALSNSNLSEAIGFFDNIISYADKITDTARYQDEIDFLKGVSKHQRGVIFPKEQKKYFKEAEEFYNKIILRNKDSVIVKKTEKNLNVIKENLNVIKENQ